MKVLIANRGEIALRIIRACRKLGLSPVAVYSEADKDALHIRYADQAFLLGPAEASQSYLNQEKILAIAKKTKAKLIHPGYGFLSENAAFAKACEKAGLIFIGPSAKTMSILGDKLKARVLAGKNGVPTLEGTVQELKTVEEFKQLCRRFGFPLMIKAVGGGGGKGIRVVKRLSEAESAFAMARSEAKTAFKNPKIYVEQFLEKGRHIEIQLIADVQGNIVSLGERECSIQRRFQKLIEESPSPMMNKTLRCEMTQAAKKIFKASQYLNAGTVEFLVDPKKNFHFLEVNTRIQVEHPATEMVRGVDLVAEQIQVALGKPVSFKEEELEWNGHAIEARIYAEDPENNFFPSPGKIDYLELPRGENIRLESSLYPDMPLGLQYDPLLAKLIALGSSRKEALRRLNEALDEFHIGGIQTTIPFFREIIQTQEFQTGKLDTQFINRWFSKKEKETKNLEWKAAAAALLHYLNSLKKERFEFKSHGERISSWQQTSRNNGLQRTHWTKTIPG